ncbi:MAG: hypothetical protein K2W95_33575 [Candidatus Obscuribacterales bacterium]|nr:hypothetical protein [Candidatus Obscuribacterales bacterium]
MVLFLLVLALFWAVFATYFAIRYRAGMDSLVVGSIYFARTIEDLKSCKEGWMPGQAKELMDKLINDASRCVLEFKGFDAVTQGGREVERFSRVVSRRVDEEAAMAALQTLQERVNRVSEVRCWFRKEDSEFC